MKTIKKIIQLKGMFLLILTFTWLYVNTSWAEMESENRFVYHQEPIRKIKEKNVKVRVAVSTFEDTIAIEDSPFNIEEEEKTAEEVEEEGRDINVVIKTDKKPEEEEVPKGELLTGLVTNALRDTDMFEVVERKEINELIREINFQHSEWTKEDNANTLGNIYGVQYIVTGDILRNKGGERIDSNYYTLTMRMGNVNTGEIVSSSTASSSYLKEAVIKSVNDLTAQVKSKAWTCRVVGISSDEVYINAGLKDELEEEDVFYINRLGDKIIDPETGETLGFVKKKIALIEIDEVLEENLSRGKILEESTKVVIGDIVVAERIDKEKKSELALWREIEGTKKDIDISDEELEHYSLTGQAYSPEAIMANFGKSVVMIQSNEALGSGFIVHDGTYIVTNYHVIKDANVVTVKMIEDNKYLTNVEVEKSNPARDIAVLNVEGNNSALPSVVLGDSDNVKIGERVVAIGNPKGFENTISDGLVSGIREANGTEYIQTSVPVTHGSSGGPLLNMQGEVIGIITAGLDEEGNLNFAVPINYVKEELLSN